MRVVVPAGSTIVFDMSVLLPFLDPSDFFFRLLLTEVNCWSPTPTQGPWASPGETSRVSKLKPSSQSLLSSSNLRFFLSNTFRMLFHLRTPPDVTGEVLTMGRSWRGANRFLRKIQACAARKYIFRAIRFFPVLFLLFVYRENISSATFHTNMHFIAVCMKITRARQRAAISRFSSGGLCSWKGRL